MAPLPHKIAYLDLNSMSCAKSYDIGNRLFCISINLRRCPPVPADA